MLSCGLSFVRADCEKRPGQNLRLRSDCWAARSVARRRLRDATCACYDNPALAPSGQWGEPMSIRCVCSNGHVLQVKESLAGKSGLCPMCKGRVDVPRQPVRAMSEEAVLDILGSASAAPRRDGYVPLEPTGDSWIGRDVRERHCDKCERLLPATMHICPYCHTYIANLRDF